MKIDQNVEIHTAKAAGAGCESQQRIVPAFFVDGDHFVQIGIVEHHVFQLFVCQKSDVSIGGRLTQSIDEGTYAVLAGGPGEKDTGLKIKEKAAVPFLLDLTGETNLRELAALIKNCSFYISADTGPLHLAAAMKKPLIALYGPTKPDRTGPYGSAKAAVLTAPLSCAGCLKKHCSKWECMKAIEPEAVYALYKKKKAEDENA